MLNDFDCERSFKYSIAWCRNWPSVDYLARMIAIDDSMKDDDKSAINCVRDATRSFCGWNTSGLCNALVVWRRTSLTIFVNILYENSKDGEMNFLWILTMSRQPSQHSNWSRAFCSVLISIQARQKVFDD